MEEEKNSGNRATLLKKYTYKQKKFENQLRHFSQKFNAEHF